LGEALRDSLTIVAQSGNVESILGICLRQSSDSADGQGCPEDLNAVMVYLVTKAGLANLTESVEFIQTEREAVRHHESNFSGHQKTLKTVSHAALRRKKVPYFRIYDLCSTCATRLSAGSVPDECVTNCFAKGTRKFLSKKYSQMKLQMKREALQKLNWQASESSRSVGT
jgi:hypothetical protein